MTMRRTTWHTHKTTCYTHDVSQDRRSAGGVHLHQVRKGKDGWQERILQSNGRFDSVSPTYDISEEEGKSLFEDAQKHHLTE